MSSFRERVEILKRQLESDIPDLNYLRGIYIDKAKVRWNQRSRFVVSFHVATGNPDLHAKRGTLPYKAPIRDTLTAASELIGEGFKTTPIVLSRRAIVQINRDFSLRNVFSGIDSAAKIAAYNEQETFRLTGRNFIY